MGTEELAKYCSGLTILYVEDDQLSGLIIQNILEPLFDKLYWAENGIEGEQLFLLYQPDLLITDLVMPKLGGIGMLQKIRRYNSKIPVILMTSSLDHTDLVEAINLGVSKFLDKPVRLGNLHRALLAITRELHLERVAQEAQLHEVELLRYRTRYHSLQQELATAKERHISIHQFEDHYLQNPDDSGGWLVDLKQHSRDIMSGDSYAAVRGNGNRLLLYLADAMGHGLSASVTSMLATAFFNHIALGCACHHLGFIHLCKSCFSFVTNNLLEDETLSGLVLELDPQQKKLRFAGCGLPAMLLVRHGQVERVCYTNPPISCYTPPLKIQELDLDGVTDILLATDGLIDGPLRTGGTYRTQLPHDLLATATAGQLFDRYLADCDDDANDDDITLIRLTAIGSYTQGEQHKLAAPGNLKGIEDLQQRVLELLKQAGADGEALDNFELALTEGLLNAFEHGCLRIGQGKSGLIQAGIYEERILAPTPVMKDEIRLTLTLSPHASGFSAWVEIADPGPGYDLNKLKLVNITEPAGRGLLVIKRMTDLMRHNQAGNRLVIMKKFIPAN